ncbi:MAG: aminopeptidase P family protein, partial [Clostridia bacterium]|nr:aminopeptidase P family protein [Clostridia bacterium]
MKIWYNKKDKKSCMLITDRTTRRYFSGFDVDEGVMLIGDKNFYLTDARSFYAVKNKLENTDIIAVEYKGIDTIGEILKTQKIKTLYLDYEKTTIAQLVQYRTFKLKIKDCSNKIKTLRSIKTDVELDKIKSACNIVEQAFYKTIKELKKGVTENQVADFIKNAMLEVGAEDISFDTIVAFGKNSAVPHHQTGDTRLEDNQVVLIDVGCKVDGYCSDLTRTVFFGTPSEDFKKNYRAVLTANLEAIKNITDNTLTCDADAIARNYLKEQGLDKFFTHSLGHGLGLDIHEFPSLSYRTKDTLKNNMAFTIEPGVYLDGEYGIRIEDTVVLKDGKVYRLFTDD